jgi:hypothetical protein
VLPVLSKVDRKISVYFGAIQNFEILDLAMAKVEKLNYAVTYLLGSPLGKAPALTENIRLGQK